MVRIGIGITVTRKMLGCHQHPLVLHPFHQGHHLSSDILPFLTKGPGANYRIGRVVINVSHRGKVHMNPHSFKLRAHIASQPIYQAVIRNSAQDHGGRISDCLFKSHAQTILTIDGYQQGDFSFLLVEIGKPGLLQGFSLEKEDSSYLLPPDLFQYRFFMSRSHVGIAIYHDHLGDPLIQ